MLTKSEGVRLIDELTAERELLARGFSKQPCADCRGEGFFEYVPDETLFVGVARAKYGRKCDRCDAQGWNWVKP